MRTFYVLNEEEKEYVLKNYMYYTNKELAEHIGNGCNRNHITKFLNDSGIKKGEKGVPHRNGRIFSDSDDEYIKENYLTMHYKDIGIKLGFTERQIRGRVGTLGLKKNREINDDYFHDINDSDKAYFLGLIYADGWVVFNEDRRNYEFGIQLQSGDKYILEELNMKLGNKNVISHIDPRINYICGKEAHRNHIDFLRVYSKKLVSDLISHGIETNKTLKDVYPIVPEHLFFDFLRGYIDGDGCYYKDNNITYMHITCASQVPLKYIQSKLMEYGIETRIYCENERKYRLMGINKAEMTKLVNHLYYSDNILFLTRKYEKIKHYLSLAIQ